MHATMACIARNLLFGGDLIWPFGSIIIIMAFKLQLQWNLANPKSLGPDGVQISEIFGFSEIHLVLMKHFVVSN